MKELQVRMRVSTFTTENEHFGVKLMNIFSNVLLSPLKKNKLNIVFLFPFEREPFHCSWSHGTRVSASREHGGRKIAACYQSVAGNPDGTKGAVPLQSGTGAWGRDKHQHDHAQCKDFNNSSSQGEFHITRIHVNFLILSPGRLTTEYCATGTSCSF